MVCRSRRGPPNRVPPAVRLPGRPADRAVYTASCARGRPDRLHATASPRAREPAIPCAMPFQRRGAWVAGPTPRGARKLRDPWTDKTWPRRTKDRTKELLHRRTHADGLPAVAALTASWARHRGASLADGVSQIGPSAWPVGPHVNRVFIMLYRVNGSSTRSPGVRIPFAGAGFTTRACRQWSAQASSGGAG